MLLTGIPHGATDHLVYFSNQHTNGEPKSWTGFIVPYFLQMALFGIVWVLFPTFSFFLFLFMTFYHFGQSELYYIGLEETNWMKRGLYIIWGAMIMTVILLGHPSETIPYLDQIVPSQWLNESMWDLIFPPIISLMSTLWLMGMLWIWLKGYVFTQDLIREIVITILLLICLQLCSLWIGFGLYFGVWHASKAIRAELSILNEENPTLSLKNWIIQALPFSLISIFGLAFLVWAWSNWGQQFHPVFLFFVGISMLTLPHMLTLENLYKLVK